MGKSLSLKVWVEVDKENKMTVYNTISSFDYWAQYGIRHEEWATWPIYLVRNSLYYLTDPGIMSARIWPEAPRFWASFNRKWYKDFVDGHPKRNAVEALEQLLGSFPNPSPYDLILIKEKK